MKDGERETSISNIGVFRVVGGAMAARRRLSSLAVFKHDLLAMHGGNRAERHDVLAGVLDVDHQLGAPVWRDPTDGTEGFARLDAKTSDPS